MTKEQFKSKAMEILSGQLFCNIPLFESDFIEDFSVSDGIGTMPLEEFLDELYEEINND